MKNDAPVQRVGTSAPDEVRALMARSRISQATLASHLEISQAAMSRRLVNEVEFTESELRRVAEYFEIEIADLFKSSPVRVPSTTSAEPSPRGSAEVLTEARSSA